MMIHIYIFTVGQGQSDMASTFKRKNKITETKLRTIPGFKKNGNHISMHAKSEDSPVCLLCHDLITVYKTHTLTTAAEFFKSKY
jgi:hypothetical protein